MKEKSVSEISIVELPRVENRRSRLCPNPLGTPPPPSRKKNPKRGTHKEGPQHALHRIFHHCEWSEYKKTNF